MRLSRQRGALREQDAANFLQLTGLLGRKLIGVGQGLHLPARTRGIGLQLVEALAVRRKRCHGAVDAVHSVGICGHLACRAGASSGQSRRALRRRAVPERASIGLIVRRIFELIHVGVHVASLTSERADLIDLPLEAVDRLRSLLPELDRRADRVLNHILVLL